MNLTCGLIHGAEVQRPHVGFHSGAVEVKNAAHFTCRNCWFAHVGATALFCSDAVADATIVGKLVTALRPEVPPVLGIMLGITEPSLVFEHGKIIVRSRPLPTIVWQQ